MISVWKEAPFIRIIIPFTFGVIAETYVRLTALECLIAMVVPVISLIIFGFTSISRQYSRYWFYGLAVNATVLFVAMLLTFYKKEPGVSTDNSLFGTVVATIEEPLSTKEKSYKTIASIQYINVSDSVTTCDGKIIIYIPKVAVKPKLQYGDRIVFNKKLQRIVNTGNPGAFDYRRYCSFQRIYFEVFLKDNEYKILPGKKVNDFKQFLFSTRKRIISILQQYIPGKEEAGLAEALLIGYKDDLDRNLVQSYSDTGVVHIIAISGLHVGLIFWILDSLLKSFTFFKKRLLLKSLFIIASLWVFSFVAGGTPSVLRSTVMFSFIVLAENISRKISVYNSLAASALILICYNPFWLWDVGFQLSYTAVVSIIVFMKPIYNCIYIKNKILDALWKLHAVTIAAQVLTIPLCLYYFHQFPNYFLIANILAVPLSSLILLGELILCAFSFFPSFAELIGSVLNWLISFMNELIKRIQSLPHSVTENIQLTAIQLGALYIVIIGLGIWMLKERKVALISALTGAMIFAGDRMSSTLRIRNQQKIIVYNIPGHQAMDLISGNKYFFQGDTSCSQDSSLGNFHLKPSRILHQIKKVNAMPSLLFNDCWILFNSIRIIFIQKPICTNQVKNKLKVDILVLSKNVKISIHEIHKVFECTEIIFDSSNSNSRISKWASECQQLNITCYSVGMKGAFVRTLN